MSTLAIELNPLGEGVEFTDDEFIVSLADGRRVSVPLIRHKRMWPFERRVGIVLSSRGPDSVRDF